jgi:hypothetical protein
MRVSRILIEYTLSSIISVLLAWNAAIIYPYRFVLRDLYLEGFRWLALIAR